MIAKQPTFFLIDGESLDRVHIVMKKLFKEDKLTADEMRDMAKSLDLAIKSAEVWEPAA